MNSIPKIAQIKPLPDYHLKVLFKNGITKDYDCKVVMERPEFIPLHNKQFFNSVKVDTGGYGISWNDTLDISEYELWTNGKEIQEINTTSTDKQFQSNK